MTPDTLRDEATPTPPRDTSAVIPVRDAVRLQRPLALATLALLAALLLVLLALTSCIPLQDPPHGAVSPNADAGTINRLGSYGFYGDPYGHPNDMPHRIRRAVIEGKKLR